MSERSISSQIQLLGPHGFSLLVPFRGASVAMVRDNGSSYLRARLLLFVRIKKRRARLLRSEDAFLSMTELSKNSCGCHMQGSQMRGVS